MIKHCSSNNKTVKTIIMKNNRKKTIRDSQYRKCATKGGGG